MPRRRAARVIVASRWSVCSILPEAGDHQNPEAARGGGFFLAFLMRVRSTLGIAVPIPAAGS